MADAHSNVSQLRALLDDGEQPQSPTEVMINEHAPLRQTKLGKALDGMMAAYAEIIALAHQSMPVPPGPTPEHIKETSEVHVKQWRDSCLDMTAELTRIALQWEYTYPEQKNWKTFIDPSSGRSSFSIAPERQWTREQTNSSPILETDIKTAISNVSSSICVAQNNNFEAITFSFLIALSKYMAVRKRNTAHEADDALESFESTPNPTTSSYSSESVISSAGTGYVQPWPPIAVEAPNWPHGLDTKAVSNEKRFRLLHWGPIIALSIIGYISAVTTHFMMMWWPFTTPDGLVHFSIFMLWNYLTLSNMFTASFIGGGCISKNWNPPKEEHKEQLQFCKPCNGYKAPRSHHCSKCNACVLKMDHHCPWINNCVGHRNHSYFIRFLFFAIIGCFHAVTVHVICAYHLVHQKLTPDLAENYVRNIAYYRDLSLPDWLSTHQIMHNSVVVWYMRFGNGSEPLIGITFWSLIALVAASAFAFGVVVGLTGLLFFQLKGIWKNRTGIEDYIDQKAQGRRDDDETGGQWFYPYDLGWKRNCNEVLFSSWSGRTKGNGIWWPVAEPCDQFTLTEEQLAQKEAKRRMARLVEISGEFRGGIFGSCSFGCKVFICQPISEDLRVKVVPGEKWVITQATKYWFYGHKFEQEATSKGWFPRSVATLLEGHPYH